MDRAEDQPRAEIEVEAVRAGGRGVALPGTRRVLRRPVAAALVKAIRAAAGLGDCAREDAEELVRYAVRRGLIGPDEGDRVLAHVQTALKGRRKTARAARGKPKKKPA